MEPATNYPPAQPTGTAYPHHNPNPHYVSPYTARRSTFLRRFIAAVISVFIIIGAIILIVWLILRPQLPEFRVDSVSVSHFNVSASQLTANWDFSIFVRNPNKKMGISYNRVGASVFYRNEFLSGTSLAPFYQGKKTQAMVHVKFVALSAYVDDRVGNQISGDRSSGVVNFNVRLQSWIKFKKGAWRTRRSLLRVVCKNVKVGFSAKMGAGTLLGGSKKCKVNL